MKIAFVVGENSSDRLGADLIKSLKRRVGPDLTLIGLGGDEMAKEGMESLFNIDELSIIGIGAIVARLPQLFQRLRQTVRHIADEKPDVLVIIDSYVFSHNVARRVRKALPNLPIINYVPPAVWAHHPERSAAMAAYVDHAICLFPFEPEIHRRLGGPRATYVGHPLMHEPHLMPIMQRLDAEGAEGDGDGDTLLPPGRPPTLLILPGSRRGEVRRLGEDFGRTLAVLHCRMPHVKAILPAVPRLKGMIEEMVAGWAVKPEIVSGEDAKWAAFSKADAALAASGTVALELALSGIPFVSCYRLDPLSYQLRHLISGWTASLPNHIVDHPLIPELFHEFIIPDALSRRLERLLTQTPERAAQLSGFAEVRRRMAIGRTPGDAAAEIVVDEIARSG